MNRTAVSPIDLSEAPESSSAGAAVIAKDMDLVGHVTVSLSALVGSVCLTIDELFALKRGEVVRMNEAVDAPITLMLNGKPVARGELVAVEDNFGLRITELS